MVNKDLVEHHVIRYAPFCTDIPLTTMVEVDVYSWLQQLYATQAVPCDGRTLAAPLAQVSDCFALLQSLEPQD